MFQLLCIIEVEGAETREAAVEQLDFFREAILPGQEYGLAIYQATPEDIAAFAKRSRARRPRRTEPIIHFAKRQDAEERVHMGPSECGSGTPGRDGTLNAQYVTAIFDNVTCKRCIKAVRATIAAEDAAAANLS